MKIYRRIEETCFQIGIAFIDKKNGYKRFRIFNINNNTSGCRYSSNKNNSIYICNNSLLIKVSNISFNSINYMDYLYYTVK